MKPELLGPKPLALKETVLESDGVSVSSLISVQLEGIDTDDLLIRLKEAEGLTEQAEIIYHLYLILYVVISRHIII